MTRNRRRPLTLILACSIAGWGLGVGGCATQPLASSPAPTPVPTMRDGAPVTSAATTVGARAAVLPSKPVQTAQLAPNVSVRSETTNVRDTSFNTRVVDDAGTLEYSFATSQNPLIPSLTRLESSWTRDLGETDRQLRVGDTISAPGAWGNPLRYAGVQLSRDESVRSDVLTAPRMALPGISTLPSAVDVLLTSAGAKDTALEQQGLAVDGRVKVAGTNSVSFVTTDASGRRQSTTKSLLESTRLADQGCSAYSLDVGKVREDYALESNAYGPWFANTTVLCGGPLGFTVEGHGEFLADQGGALGLGLARQLPLVGVASVGVSSSQDSDASGWLARFGIEHKNSLFDLNVRTRVQSAGFRRAGAIAVEDPVARSTIASLGLKVSRASDLALVYASEITHAQDVAALIALSQRTQLSKLSSLSMTAGQSLTSSDLMSVFLSFTRAFGRTLRPSSDLPDYLRLVRTAPIGE